MASPAPNPIKASEGMFDIGTCWLVLTVAFYHCGKVKRRDGNLLEFEPGSWRVEDAGEIRNAVSSGKFTSAEIVNAPCIVNLDAMTAAFRWPHEVPVATL